MNVDVGTIIGGRRVAEIGEMGGVGMNCPNMLPVRFQDGQYAVLVGWNGEGCHTILVSDNEECNRAIAESVAMPIAEPGIASDVLHIRVKDANGGALLKIFYNAKAGMGDQIHRH